MRSRWSIVLCAVAVLACERDPSARPARNPLEAPPVDSARVGSVEQVAAWRYHREASADLDGDGRMERVIVASDVELAPEGGPLWEDGHRWGVYVVSPDSARTLMYGAFVPNGSVEAAIMASSDKGIRHLLVQERTPQQVRVLEIEYGGPGVARSLSSAYYQIEQWLPGTASAQ